MSACDEKKNYELDLKIFVSSLSTIVERKELHQRAIEFCLFRRGEGVLQAERFLYSGDVVCAQLSRSELPTTENSLEFGRLTATQAPRALRLMFMSVTRRQPLVLES